MYEQKALGLAIAFVTAIVLLSSIVFCEDTSVTAKVIPAISITPPEGASSWNINPAIMNTYTKNLIVNANADWEVGVKSINATYMQAKGASGKDYKLLNSMYISTTNITPFKLSSSTNNYFLKGTKHGSNQIFPITFQQQGSFDDIVEENDTPIAYSIVVTFTGKLM